VHRDGHDIDAVAQTSKQGILYVFDRDTGQSLYPIEERPVPASDIDGETTANTQPFALAPQPFARQRLTEDMLTRRTRRAHSAVLAKFRKLRSAGQFVPGSKEGTVIFPGFDGGAEWAGSAWDPETGLLYVNANEMAWILKLIEQHPAGPNTTGRELYVTNCSACHRTDLGGAPPEFPSLQKIGERYSSGELTTLLNQGTGRMPAFSRLGESALKAIANYVLSGENTSVHNAGADPSLFMKYLNNGYQKFLDPDGYPAVKPPWGTLNAIDVSTGKPVWTVPFGEYPKLAAKGMRNTGSENYGGPVVTAGGLVFIGATSYDRKFHAFDKATGELLWQTKLPFSGNATPATYEVDGRQYVVIAAGGGKSKDPSGGTIVAFALP